MIERIASCTCGKVRLQTRGAPIVSAICHCDSCQAGGRMIEALPNAAPVRDIYGGTPYLTYRDDRYRVTHGAELLRGLKLSDDAPTTRYVATCCNSAMYLKYAPGWWVSTYRTRFSGDLPPVQFRSNVKSDAVPKDVSAYRGFPMMLLARLMGARVAMVFGG